MKELEVGPALHHQAALGEPDEDGSKDEAQEECVDEDVYNGVAQEVEELAGEETVVALGPRCQEQKDAARRTQHSCRGLSHVEAERSLIPFKTCDSEAEGESRVEERGLGPAGEDQPGEAQAGCRLREGRGRHKKRKLSG